MKMVDVLSETAHTCKQENPLKFFSNCSIKILKNAHTMNMSHMRTHSIYVLKQLLSCDQGVLT